VVTIILKYREVESIQHPNVPNVGEVLRKIHKFLQEHETPSSDDCTHIIFDNYPDWWMSRQPTFKLSITEDNTLDTLYRFISILYDLSIPLTLTEKRTPEIRFVQNIKIWGTQTEMVKPEELISVGSKFLEMVGKTMVSIFPKHNFLDVVAFDSSGVSKTKGVMKTSIRLVWSSIIVDKERAARIRDYMVHKFKDTRDEQIRALFDQMQTYSKDNQWNTVFSDEAYYGRWGVRMPLCDRVSPAPLKKPEKRPFTPFGVLRFNCEEGLMKDSELLCEADGLEGFEWLKIGCLRRDVGTPLTEWTAPVWRGVRESRAATNTNGGYPGPGGGAQGGDGDGAKNGGGGGGGRDRGPREQVGRVPGQVRIRTAGGSDQKPQRARPRNEQQVREEKQMTVEREFDGTLAEFREKLETAMGSQAEAFTQDESRLVWQKPGDTARIEMKASNKRVYIIGKVHQLRSLTNAVAPFARCVGEAARSVAATSNTGSRRGPGSGRGGPGSQSGAGYSAAPSQVYNPSTAGGYAPSAVFSAGAASHVSIRSTSSQQSGVQQRRQANRAFASEGTGELELNLGDIVTVTHDSGGGSDNNIHRWVFGANERGDRGWFPLSHTTALQEPQAQEHLQPEEEPSQTSSPALAA